MGLLPMGADILPPSDDRVFKLLLTDPRAKPGLIKLISAIIGRNVVDVTLYPNEPPLGSMDEKAERLDINCKIDDGSQINLEMQASYLQEIITELHKNLIGKSVYYATDLHSSQPSKGLQRYDQLPRTYQITFCTYTIFRNQPEYVNSFSLRHDKTGELLCDAIQIYFVELSKLKDLLDKPVSELTALDKWSLFLQYAPNQEHREKVNEIIESEEVLQMAGNLLMSISQDERERAIFRSRRKFQTDLQSDLATAEDRGKAIGKEIGISIGEKNRSIEIARKLLSRNRPIDEIMEDTGLTLTEIENLR